MLFPFAQFACDLAILSFPFPLFDCELARCARSAVLQVPGLSPCPPFDFAEVYYSRIKGKRERQIRPNRRRNCANGKSVSLAIGNICAGRFVSPRQTPSLLSCGKKNLRLCESGSAPPPHASRQRCSVIISIFDSTTESSLTTIKSRSRKKLLQHPDRRTVQFAKKAFVSSSTRHRTRSRCNFPCYWK